MPREQVALLRKKDVARVAKKARHAAEEAGWDCPRCLREYGREWRNYLARKMCSKCSLPRPREATLAYLKAEKEERPTAPTGARRKQKKRGKGRKAKARAAAAAAAGDDADVAMEEETEEEPGAGAWTEEDPANPDDNPWLGLR
jgi:hypothetical protein